MVLSKRPGHVAVETISGSSVGFPDNILQLEPSFADWKAQVKAAWPWGQNHLWATSCTGN